jgi:hypothetical protein
MSYTVITLATVGVPEDRLLLPDIVHFHLACLGTKIFLPERTRASTLSSNLQTSAPLTCSFLANCYFIFTNFTANFFIVQRYGLMTTHDYIYITQNDQFLLR